MDKGNSKQDFRSRRSPQPASGRTCVAMDTSMHLCECFFFSFHLLHPVLSAFAGVLMPDVVSGVGERHSPYSALHLHLPLIHLPGSTICISYLCRMLKTQLGGDCLHQAASHMLVRWTKKKTKKLFDCIVLKKTLEYDLSIVSTDTCLIKILFPVQHTGSTR